MREEHKRWNEELTSGTVKLMAISSLRGWSNASELVEKGLRWRSWSSRTAPPRGKVKLELWNDVMEKEYPRRNYL